MGWRERFNSWYEFHNLEPSLKENLIKMSENEQQIEEAFYKPLEFGTGGMRGVIGPGTNRMNIYTVRKAAKGLALYLEDQPTGFKERGVVVAFDSRYMSKEFAIETARVLGFHNIPTYIFTSLRPTPELSFAVRYLKTSAGVMITASHNPPEYNGYKVYNKTGGQLTLSQADEVIGKVNKIDNELLIDVLTQQELEDSELLRWIGEEVDQAYLKELNQLVGKSYSSKLNIVFTPLHGTANDLTLAGFKRAGFEHINVVDEQVKPDPEFSTVESPNPEEHQAFELAIEKGIEVGADILVATDPDADRLGVAAINSKGEYQVLTGNQLGALMLDFILSKKEFIPNNAVIIKTIVTSELGKAVADYYGVKTKNVLTGFKFISEKIEEFNQTESHEFMFGYEESYGYLINDFSRDKDAIQSTLIASNMAEYYKAQGKTLFDALEDLYERHGYYLEDLHSIKLEGLVGSKQINSIMESFRVKPIASVGNLTVQAVEDYQSSIRTYMQTGNTETIDLPNSNVVKFILSDDCWFCLRPSGTEPKIKFYFGVRGDTLEESKKRLNTIKESVLNQISVITN